MNKKKQRIGETTKNKNGQTMTIIAYRDCRDIDVQFEDGTIVCHQRMENFTAQRIVNPNYKIAYDISVNEFIMQFYFQQIGFNKYECGELNDYGLENYSLDLFNPTVMIGIEYDGKIHEHNTDRDEKKDILCRNNGIQLIRIRERINNTKIAKCYSLSTPTHFSQRYENILKDITQHLHDTASLPLITIDFKKDRLVILDKYSKKHVMPRIGEEYTSQRGEHAKIIKYFSAQEVTIEFDDGFTKNTSMHALRKGYFYRYPWSYYQAQINALHVGEVKTMTNGMPATLIAYRSYNDVDVQFEDGTILTNKRYTDFVSRRLSNPNYKSRKYKARKKHLQETATMKNGQTATIIGYHSYKDIAVQLDDGTVLIHQDYENFKKGYLASPGLKLKPSNFCSRVGESQLMKCGQMATIIAYRGNQDIDVQFEDNTIVYNKSYGNFKKAAIAHPKYPTKSSLPKTDYVGETALMNCGIKATIIAARSSKDIDVQFEDGTIVYQKGYDKFSRGRIAHPNIPVVTYSKMNKKNHTGESRVMNCGIVATIIQYRHNQDMDIQFADGTVVQNRRYSDFKRGCIANPNLKKQPIENKENKNA